MSNLENNNRKEEILAKSRESSTPYADEGMENAINKGLKMGSHIAGTIVGIPLFFLSLVAGQMIVVYALFSLGLAMWVGEFLAKYRFTQQKRYLIATIVFAVSGIGTAVLFVIETGLIQSWWG